MKKFVYFFLSIIIVVTIIGIEYVSYKHSVSVLEKRQEDKCRSYGEVTGRTVLYKNDTCFVHVNNLWYTQEEVGYLLIKPPIIKK